MTKKLLVAFGLMIGLMGCQRSMSAQDALARGKKPTKAADGTFQNCNILYQGLCFASDKVACTAAGCPNKCSILESYPGRVSCEK